MTRQRGTNNDIIFLMGGEGLVVQPFRAAFIGVRVSCILLGRIEWHIIKLVGVGGRLKGRS